MLNKASLSIIVRAEDTRHFAPN